MSDSTADYDYDLPTELIAQRPVEPRDASRLLVLNRGERTIAHRRFADLPELLRPGDLLVVNESRVVPAKLEGFRTQTKGRWEGLFLREDRPGTWQVIGQTRGKLQAGETITLQANQRTGRAGEQLELRLVEQSAGGAWLVQPLSVENVLDLLERFGRVPLPPYMEREADAADLTRYQTTYAMSPGSVAAPTAGLHFTSELFETLRSHGVGVARVTLHVGLGTFRPIGVERLSEHTMHAEWCELPEETAEQIARTKAAGGRVIAVGTTTVRTLESAKGARGWRGETDLFIRPPYEFRRIDGMITNFHLPKSTLLVLVSTFAGREFVLQAYRAAVQERYRFYSYGDAMLIL
jgi:S-adenosylmethionine:tRNA ribosyltransferase-isomerase